MKTIAVDDEIYMLETLQEAVSSSSDVETVEAFSSCSAALAYATENPIDVAFLDINMRGIGGLVLPKNFWNCSLAARSSSVPDMKNMRYLRSGSMFPDI